LPGGGVHQRVIGGEQPVGGYVFAERAAPLPALDQREDGDVELFVCAAQCVLAEFSAAGGDELEVAVELAPGGLDQPVERLGWFTGAGVCGGDRFGGAADDAFGESLEQLGAGGKVGIERHARHTRRCGDGGHAGVCS